MDHAAIDIAKSAGTRFGELKTTVGRRIAGYLEQYPELRPLYRQAKGMRRILRKSHNYDLTSRCNLFCEGCLYFEGDDYKQAEEVTDGACWEEFFRAQAAAGVTFAWFSGAEPCLVQDRLAHAAEHIPRGSISTNGTIPIRPDIPYSIQVSVWGDENSTAHFRGGDVFWKTIRNCSGDPRVRIVFTINPNNLSQIPGVVRIMEDQGLRIMFNCFSPPKTYLDKLDDRAENDHAFFRISSDEENLVFDAESLASTRDLIDEMIVRYPATVIHNHAFNAALTMPRGLYHVDAATDVAINCNARNFEWHQAYRVDLSPSDGKCCMPNIDCSNCRLYIPAINSFIFQPERFVDSIGGFRDWLDICDQFAIMFLLDDDPERSCSPSAPASHARLPGSGRHEA